MTRHGNSRHEPKRDIQVSRLRQDRDMKKICLKTVLRQDTCLETPSLATPNHRQRDVLTTSLKYQYLETNNELSCSDVKKIK